jgi:hypothetical protein
MVRLFSPHSQILYVQYCRYSGKSVAFRKKYVWRICSCDGGGGVEEGGGTRGRLGNCKFKQEKNVLKPKGAIILFRSTLSWSTPSPPPIPLLLHHPLHQPIPPSPLARLPSDESEITTGSATLLKVQVICQKHAYEGPRPVKKGRKPDLIVNFGHFPCSQIRTRIHISNTDSNPGQPNQCGSASNNW